MHQSISPSLAKAYSIHSTQRPVRDIRVAHIDGSQDDKRHNGVQVFGLSIYDTLRVVLCTLREHLVNLRRDIELESSIDCGLLDS